VTAAEFKAAFPEFSNADDDLVESEIANAEEMCPEDVWSVEAKRTRGIGLTVAQSLALSPAGRGMQLESDGKTVYDERLNDLRRYFAGGPRAI
jgi:hypothetical protein